MPALGNDPPDPGEIPAGQLRGDPVAVSVAAAADHDPETVGCSGLGSWSAASHLRTSDQGPGPTGWGPGGGEPPL